MTLDDLKESPRKVTYFAETYAQMRRGVIAHVVKIDSANVEELRGMSFVFLAMDAGPTKRTIVEQLTEWAIPFVDCGMGVTRLDNSLRGSVRVTTAPPSQTVHLASRISYRYVIATNQLISGDLAL